MMPQGAPPIYRKLKREPRKVFQQLEICCITRHRVPPQEAPCTGTICHRVPPQEISYQRKPSYIKLLSTPVTKVKYVYCKNHAGRYDQTCHRFHPMRSQAVGGGGGGLSSSSIGSGIGSSPNSFGSAHSQLVIFPEGSRAIIFNIIGIFAAMQVSAYLLSRR